MKKRFLFILSLIAVLCGLPVGCGDLSYGSISSNHPIATATENSEDPVPEQADSLPEREGNSMEYSENVPDTTSIDDNIDIPEEYLTENSNVEYTVDENGDYVYEGMHFRHKLVLTRRSPKDKHFISVYIVLTNDTELTVEKIIKNTLGSKGVPANEFTQEYPSYYYVVVGNHVYEEPHDLEDSVPEQADSLPEQEGNNMECSENVPDTTFAEDNIDIPEEYLTENYDVEYTVNENGEYVWNGLLFRHKLVLTSRATRDKHIIFVDIVLTNDTELTNEKIFKDSISSQAIPLDVTQEYPSFYVVLGGHVLYEELHDPEDPVPEQADSLPEQEGNSMEYSENVPDITSTEDNIDIPEEYLTENYDVEYTVNENGEYVWDNDLLFRHKLVLTSRDPRNKHFISIYIVLTNDTELTVEKISKDHLSSYIVPLGVTQEYPSYYVVLGHHVYEEPH